jgi:hypothetical protein
MVSDSFCLSAEKVLRKRPIFAIFGISSHIKAQMGAYLVYNAVMEPLILKMGESNFRKVAHLANEIMNMRFFK